MAPGLILDISLAGFVAVVDERDQLLAKRWRGPGSRYDDVGEWVGDCLREAGYAYADLKWIAAGIGPGSFTGIRIAMAFAQGLALPRSLPLYGFTSFSALFASYGASPENNDGERGIAVIPANSGRFYVAKSPEDPGALLETEQALALPSGRVLIVPCRTPAVEAIASKFDKVREVNGDWNVSALARSVRAAGTRVLKPYYLQLSAAEEKAAKL
jgi:tRNA threonylcarbamoyladenosine biosynthesis protein TsaB